MSETAATPMTLTGTQQPKKDEAKLTEYVVLKDIGEKGWQEVSREIARSAKQAVTYHVTANKIEGGTFIAVPARSWGPITVKTETKTKLAFS